MKKIFIISCLIFTILLCYFSTTYAAITVTEESIQNSFDKYATNEENLESNNSIKFDKSKKIINLTLEGDTYNIGYDLSEKATFNIDLSFDKSMTKEDWENEANKTSLFMLLFVLIADHEGIDSMDSMTYMMSSAFKNLTLEQFIDTSNITNAIDYAKLVYDKDTELKDTLFTLSTKKTSETIDEYKVNASFVVNTEADFSIINGSTNNTMNEISNSIISSMQNIANNNYNHLEQEQVAVNKITDNLNKLPQTGDFFKFKDALILISIVSSILLIVIVFKDIKYRNINKK